jgi:tRNA (Thr-GGU) A37 N-methylase
VNSIEMRPIGFVRNAYTDASQIPKGLGASHTAEGIVEIRAELEEGLTDIEGFSHLFVIWVFDRSEGYALVGTPPCDDRPHGVPRARRIGRTRSG